MVRVNLSRHLATFLYWAGEDRQKSASVGAGKIELSPLAWAPRQPALECLQEDWLVQVSLRGGGGYKGRLRYGAFPMKKCPPARRDPGTNPTLHLVPVCPQEVLDIVVHVSCRRGINKD